MTSPARHCGRLGTLTAPVGDHPARSRITVALQADAFHELLRHHIAGAEKDLQVCALAKRFQGMGSRIRTAVVRTCVMTGLRASCSWYLSRVSS